MYTNNFIQQLAEMAKTGNMATIGNSSKADEIITLRAFRAKNPGEICGRTFEATDANGGTVQYYGLSIDGKFVAFSGEHLSDAYNAAVASGSDNPIRTVLVDTILPEIDRYQVAISTRLRERKANSGKVYTNETVWYSLFRSNGTITKAFDDINF